MDYSSQEILDFIHGDTLDGQIEKVREKLDYYKEKKNIITMCMTRTEISWPLWRRSGRDMEGCG